MAIFGPAPECFFFGVQHRDHQVRQTHVRINFVLATAQRCKAKLGANSSLVVIEESTSIATLTNCWKSDGSACVE